ncbi:hypothetical protein KGD82_27745 (plasmid) [Nocardiopsis eucommiae]|uniref:Uncharacterized protein n=1 Tax=Nocardiopsis eucommiae TaxID=2831970 RepID=A0A975LE01_9ACTN|nr:hypothetical protein KGD82_27745 [Nocardiopsis eucommiae]
MTGPSPRAGSIALTTAAERVDVARSFLVEWDTLPLPRLWSLVHEVVERVDVDRRSESEVYVTTVIGGDTRTEDLPADHAANAAKAREAA